MKTQLLRITTPDKDWERPDRLVQTALEHYLNRDDRWREVKVEVVKAPDDVAEPLLTAVTPIDADHENQLRDAISHVYWFGKEAGLREAYDDVASYIQEVR